MTEYRDPKLRDLQAKRDLQDHAIRKEGRLSERRRILAELCKLRDAEKSRYGKSVLDNAIKHIRGQGKR